MRPLRAQVWRLIGAPDEQIGSVNEPRATEENGYLWNEKWIHYCDPGGAEMRIVLWNRYDFVGMFRVTEDGSWHSEPLPDP